jgi:hypothetical protein
MLKIPTELPPSKTDFDSPAPSFRTEKENEKSIASLNADQIKGIATTLIGHVMKNLKIDIENTDILKDIAKDANTGELIGYFYAQKFDLNSKLMKFLLPTFIEIITQKFSVPSEFVQNGIAFDFLNKDKNGLLDKVEDEVLRNEILKGMGDHQTLTATLKVKPAKALMLKMDFYSDDNKCLGDVTSSVSALVNTAKDCLI